MIAGVLGIFIISSILLFGSNSGEYMIKSLANMEQTLAEQTEQMQEIKEYMQILSRIYMDGGIVLNSQTLLIYEYYNPETGEIDIVKQYSPYFLQNLSIQELSAIFINWEILEYNPYTIRLRQNTQNTSQQKYIIGIQNGHIAVWEYDTGIIEITNRPITALALEEQQRLTQGIIVNGNEELIRALEDFSS